MANFLFNEGVVAAMTTGLDWTNTTWRLDVYETPLVPTATMSWGDVSANVVASVNMAAPVLTTSGAASTDDVAFTGVTTTPGQTLFGFFITRASDDLLLTHIDSGYEGISPGGGGFGSVLQLDVQTIDYNFIIRLGANNERAWFRL